MTNRSLRRAAERQAVKAARKAERAQSPGLLSPAQLTANRANAQLSTGPVTPEGKEISSRNHTTHGLTAIPGENFKVLPTESQAAYDQLLADYNQEWIPNTPTQQDLVTRLATHAWLRDRAIRLQNQILLQVGEEMAVDQRKDFGLYMRYYNTHARAYNKALADLMRLRNFQIQQETKAAALRIRFESQKQKTELHTAKIKLIQLRKEAIKLKMQPPPKPIQAVGSVAGLAID